MAQQYSIPPWVQGLSPGQAGALYEGGVRTGVGIQEQHNQQIMQAQEAAQRFAMEQARLAQEKQQTDMQLQLREKSLAQETERQRQQLEMTKAYHEQVTSLRQQDLEISKQKAQQAAQQAAQKFAAQQAFQAEAGDFSDPERVKTAVLKYGGAMGGMSGPMSAAMKAMEDQKQYGGITTEDLPGGAKVVYRKGSPGLHVIPPEKSHEVTASALASLAKAVPDLELAAKRAPGGMSAKLLDRIKPMLEQAQSSSGTATHRYNPKTKKIEPITDSTSEDDEGDGE